MTYTLKITPELPMFSEHVETKVLKKKFFRQDGSSFWSYAGVAIVGNTVPEGYDNNTRVPKYMRQERPKRMKKLLRTVKRTKGQIASVYSSFIGGLWTKTIIVI